MEEPKRYVEEPKRDNKAAFLSDDEYGKAIQSFIITCTDFVPIDREKKLVYLAKRVVHSSKGLWRFGGRQKAFETMRESLVRLAKRETGLELASERFAYLMTTEDIWAWRKQTPEEVGGHNLIHVFSVELSDGELVHASSHLDPTEYDVEFGIKPFDLRALKDAGAREQLIDMYNAIFSR